MAGIPSWTASMGIRLLSETTTSSESAEEAHAEEHEDVTDQGVGALIFALAIGVISRAYLKSIVPLPYTVQVLVVGIGVGAILEHWNETGLGQDLSVSLDEVRFMNPEIILFALLPILIFESAFFTDVHIFLREVWQVMTLAGPGVIVATITTACFSRYVFPYDWDWNTALYFGAMCSATDPVAVVALMKELGVSERLAVLIEGESLMNDGTSIVVFSVFFDAATGAGSTSVATVITQGLRLGLGGPCVGLFVGTIGAFFVGYILEDHLSEITCTVVVCFSAFLLAEATPLKVSGVLAVVVGGLYMSFYGRPRISPSVQEPLHEFWSLWGYMANTVIFFVTGLTAATKAFGADSMITGRDWGYLVLLYVAVHIIRGSVIFMSYPVLKHGYGTNWKQLTVLTYAGLRGAVGLTLALIVQQQATLGNIDEEVGDKVIFHMGGLAIMTLLINGTTCGKLISFFGMDRATKAQTEIFIRACSAVESKLEHVVEELKKDRFLGDSDWPVVWRYIPVMTSRVYWHRIRYGSVVLANGEEEEIQANAPSGMWGFGSNAGGRLQRRLSTVSASGINHLRWGTGTEGGAARGGSRFAHLPPRLRNTWQKYHRKFHITEEVEEEGGVDRVIESNIAGEYGNENYRAMDQTVHMPRSGMVRESIGGQGDPHQSNSRGRSWGSNLDQAGVGGLAPATGGSTRSVRDGIRSLISHMSHGVGVSRSTSKNGLGPDSAVRGEASRIAGMDASGRGMGGRSASGQGDSRAAMMSDLDDGGGMRRGSSAPAGIKTTSSHHDFSRIAAAGDPLSAQGSRGGTSSARFSRKPGAMGGFAGSMSALDAAVPGSSGRHTTDGSRPSFLQNGSQHRPLGHSSQHRPLGHSSSHRLLGSGSQHRPLGHSSQHRGLASAAAAAAAAAEGSRASGGLGDIRVMKEIEATKSGLSLAKEHLHHVEGKLKKAISDAEKLPERREAASGLGGGHGRHRSRSSLGAGMGLVGSGHAPRPSLAQSVKSVASSKTGLQAAEHLEALAEARLRFVAAVKANYQDNFRKGWLSDSGLRVLQGNADVQLDAGHLPLQEWARLRESFSIPDYQLNMASALRYLPFVGQVVGGWIFKKLAFVFELASNFIAAHEDIAILELLPEGDAADQLARENLKQLDDASATLGQQLPAFPEVARSLKTQVAARFLLAKHRHLVEELYLDGFINEKERETILHVNTEFKIKLDDHPYAEHLPPRAVMLAKVPFLKTLNDEQMSAIVDDDTFCQEEFHGSNVVLCRQGEEVKFSGHNRGSSGWYYIVRGSVQMVTVTKSGKEMAAGALESGTSAGAGGVGAGTGVGNRGSVEYAVGAEEREGAPKVREHPLHAGAVFGMTDMMLGLPFRATYTTTSFVHLFFFDRRAFLKECARSEDLNRALWRTVGVSVLRKFYGFHRMRLQELQKMVQNSEFVDLGEDGVGEDMNKIEYKVEELRAKAAHRVESKQHSSYYSAVSSHPSTRSLDGMTSSAPTAAVGAGDAAVSGMGLPVSSASLGAGGAGGGEDANDDDDGRIHVHKLNPDERGVSLAKTLSNMGLYNMGSIPDATLAAAASALTPHSIAAKKASLNSASAAQTLKVVDVEARRLVLLVKGQLLPRPTTASLPGVEMHTAPCLLTDVSGRLVFTKDAKMFLIPMGVVERSRSSFAMRRTRLEKEAHREDTIKDLNEHRGPGARRIATEELQRVTQDALGVGGRTDLGARQALTRKHSEMAKRASEKQFFGGEEGLGGLGGVDGTNPAADNLGDVLSSRTEEGGGTADGGSGDGESFAPRKSFVAKRSWGSIKMVEVDDDQPVSRPNNSSSNNNNNRSILGSIMEERERAGSAVSVVSLKSVETPTATTASSAGGAQGTSGSIPWRGRLSSASSRLAGRLGRAGSGAREELDDEEKRSDCYRTGTGVAATGSVGDDDRAGADMGMGEDEEEKV